MEHVLVVDGSNLLFQMFYGMPQRIENSRGKAIQGTLGFVGALLKILRWVKPTHVAVLFDGEHENPRRALDENYKANREDFSQLPEEETPFCQLPDIYAALTYLKIPHRETQSCEADDWIAGYARRYGEAHRVTAVSQDSDLFQLITDQVQILRYRGEKSVLCDRYYLQEKLGIYPEQYADFKSLTGDTADNIRGAQKVGVKTAAQLLAQFGTLEQILTHPDQIQKPSVRKSIEESKERLRTNQRLIRLTGDAQLPFSLDEMVYRDAGLSTLQVLQAIGVR